MKKYLIFIIILLTLMIASCNDIQDEKILDCKEDRYNELCQDPEYWNWEFNKTGYDGQGSKIIIMSESQVVYNPYNSTSNNQYALEKIALIENVEKKYNVDISLEVFPKEVKTILEQRDYIKNNPDKIYVINSSIVKSLVTNDNIVSLDAMFKTINYKQDKYYNQLTEVNGKVYGYNNDAHYPDSYLYYNQTIIDSLGLEDPATLWNKGEWTWEKMFEICDKAYPNMGNNSVLLTYYINDFIMTYFMTHGINPFVNNKLTLNQLAILEAYEKLQEKARIDTHYWYNTYKHSTANYLSIFNGKFLFSTDSFRHCDEGWYWEYANEENLEISVVPYPRANNDPNLKNYRLTADTDYVTIFGKNTKIPTEILFNIVDDLNNAYKPQEKLKKETFETYLRERIKSEESIKAVLSTSNIPEVINFDSFGPLLDKTDKNDYDDHSSKILFEYSIEEIVLIQSDIEKSYQILLDDIEFSGN